MEVFGTITDIKRFAIHDGPGIRVTVFFKGCPLSCWWCHNPECIAFSPQLVHYESRCMGCLECVRVCPTGALEKGAEGPVIHREKCIYCRECEKMCPTGAMEVAGRRVSVGYLIKEVEKDLPFMRNSGGGLTLSGGEPLAQADFAEALLREAKGRGIHTAVDTCGHVPFSVFERVCPFTDLFLYDLKFMDREKHRKYTGVYNNLILENLEKLLTMKAEVQVRIPVLPGINDSEMKDMAAWLSLKGVKDVVLLPYHRAGEVKYSRLGMNYRLKGMRPPSKQQLDEIKGLFEREGIKVKVGG